MGLIRLLTLACALLLVVPVVRADCECLWQGSFVDVQGDSDLVISGTVVTAKGNSIDLAVNRHLRGHDAAETIRVWLQTADFCRPEASLFPVGSQWVMALHRINDEVPGGFNPNTPNVSYGRLGDYSLSSCGGYWLQQHGDFVSGNLVNATRWVRDPPMTPVLLDLVDAYVRGEVPRDALAKASRENPAVRELMRDTNAYLRDVN